jgi:hypothetical protein
MQKRKLPRDTNALAAQIVVMSTGQPLPKLTESVPAASQTIAEPEAPKNPAAVALGRLGGLKGGKARADSLSKAKRVEIARLAAAARWKKSED